MTGDHPLPACNFHVFSIHRRPDLLESCCELLNGQWPRGMTARMRSLKASCDSFPVSLVLTTNTEPGIVVGHGKISGIPNLNHACFIESVVIKQELRGKGLGRYLMVKSEEYAKSLGMKTAYLTTHDQQGFYSRLGYETCEPICVWGGSPGLFKLVQKSNTNAFENLQATSRSPNISTKITSTPLPHPPAPPPAPPPPPPPQPSSPKRCEKDGPPKNVYMKKDLVP